MHDCPCCGQPVYSANLRELCEYCTTEGPCAPEAWCQEDPEEYPTEASGLHNPACPNRVFHSNPAHVCDPAETWHCDGRYGHSCDGSGCEFYTSPQEAQAVAFIADGIRANMHTRDVSGVDYGREDREYWSDQDA